MHAARIGVVFTGLVAGLLAAPAAGMAAPDTTAGLAGAVADRTAGAVNASTAGAVNVSTAGAVNASTAGAVNASTAGAVDASVSGALDATTAGVAGSRKAVAVAGGSVAGIRESVTEIREPEPRPDLSGVRIKAPNRPEIYLIDPEGYRRWIPNPATFDALFRNWEGVITDINTVKIPQRSAIDEDAVLAKSKNSPRVYLISNGQKRWVVSPAVFDRNWFAWDKIREFPEPVLNAIPTGSDWS
ncbi:hypothetical protein [Actinoplanes sp. G11-F43]|uniref:hypothetical protein n=1 Tax=Actinoplanes sp. G11-F43 TaxID=3424130 RepID=UPI003D3418FE